jgi:hypothetical protein
MFVDRHEAGRRLAERLLDLRSEDPLVLGLPRGGVPVAAEVADAGCPPLDVLVVKKLGCPWPWTGSNVSPDRASMTLRGSTGTKDCARRRTAETVPVERAVRSGVSGGTRGLVIARADIPSS